MECKSGQCGSQSDESGEAEIEYSKLRIQNCRYVKYFALIPSPSEALNTDTVNKFKWVKMLKKMLRLHWTVLGN